MQASLDVPRSVQRTLDGLLTAAQRAFGDTLRSVILYGSAAEGRMRASSDVNLLFVLSSFDAQRANEFREPFRFAASAAKVTAMFILEEELRGPAAQAFAQKFADIKRRHVLLYGVDPFPAVTIARESLVRRLQQVLLNLSIRLREMYVERSLRAEQCAATVAEAAGPLRTSAASILELETGQLLQPKEALSRMVREMNRPEFNALLPHISEAREELALPAGKEAAILFDTLELARALHMRSTKLG